MSLVALEAWWSFMETPKKRIFPSLLSSSTASSQPPLVGPDVELLHVYGLEPEVLEARLGALPDVVSGVDLVGVQPRRSGPDAILGRDLGGDVDGLFPLCQHLSHEPLAVPLAVGESRVYEVKAEVYGSVQRAERLVVLGADPGVLADPPRPVADLGDLQPRPAELSVVHVSLHSYSLPNGFRVFLTTTRWARNRPAGR